MNTNSIASHRLSKSAACWSLFALFGVGVSRSLLTLEHSPVILDSGVVAFRHTAEQMQTCAARLILANVDFGPDEYVDATVDLYPVACPFCNCAKPLSC